MNSVSLLDGIIPLWPFVSAAIAAVCARAYLPALFLAPVVYIGGLVAFGLSGVAPTFTVDNWGTLISILAAVEGLTLLATWFAISQPVTAQTN